MGSFNEDLFKHSFDFLKDKQQREMKDLEKAMEKEKNPERLARLKLTHQRFVYPNHLSFPFY